MPFARQQGCPPVSENKPEGTHISGNPHPCDSIRASTALSPALIGGNSSGRGTCHSSLPRGPWTHEQCAFRVSSSFGKISLHAHEPSWSCLVCSQTFPEPQAEGKGPLCILSAAGVVAGGCLLAPAWLQRNKGWSFLTWGSTVSMWTQIQGSLAFKKIYKKRKKKGDKPPGGEF